MMSDTDPSGNNGNGLRPYRRAEELGRVLVATLAALLLLTALLESRAKM